jgi:cytochrome P450
MVKNKHAFAPFGMGEYFVLPTIQLSGYLCLQAFYGKANLMSPISTGRTSCVGQGLATTQIRLALASLVKKFRVRFLPGEDGREVVRDMKDQLTAQPGMLKLMFELRE